MWCRRRAKFHKRLSGDKAARSFDFFDFCPYFPLKDAVSTSDEAEYYVLSRGFLALAELVVDRSRCVGLHLERLLWRSAERTLRGAHLSSLFEPGADRAFISDVRQWTKCASSSIAQLLFSAPFVSFPHAWIIVPHDRLLTNTHYGAS
jgi:hypothetical protein